MKEGDRGFCFVRRNVDGEMVLDTYGKSTGFCIDPIEKKPLSHFLPGTPVLSFGTAGCNLGCKFCQNWDISKSREVARLSDHATPNDIALAAKNSGCRSVAYTYNDPVIWAEYAIDTARACREHGIKSVAVTAGYITEEARADFFAEMDAANIDLKAFEEDFYFKLTGSHLQPVLDTIRYVCNETDCWVELTNLIIPDANDSADEIRRMSDWLLENVGPNVPIHFTAFHPDFRMTDRPRTSHDTLIMAYDVARRAGLNYVYVGNVHDVARQSTYCHACKTLLVERDWHQLGRYHLQRDQCASCGAKIPGVYEEQPGTWGARRQRVQIVASEPEVVQLGQGQMTASKTENELAIREMTELTDEEKMTLYEAASALVAAAVYRTDPAPAVEKLGDLAEMPIHGVFVTVKRGETLRGCCGRQGAEMQLGEALVDSAARTARDPRMAPLSASELPFLDLSVSLLGANRPIGARGADREAAVEVGVHGLRIQMGGQSGLLLPQVPTEQGWDARQFLDAVCRKAGLPAGTWQSDEADLQLFDGIHFGGDFVIDPSKQAAEPRLLAPQELTGYRDWVKSNLIAIQSGATPMYYATGLSDLEVLGVALCVTDATQHASQWLQLSVKDTRPLQSSLYQMTEQAARSLGVPADQCQVDLAILDGCVHHGEAAAADVRGIDPATRAVLATDGRRWAIRFDASGDVSDAVDTARGLEVFRGDEQLYSFRCDCTSDKISVSVGPRAVDATSARPPAVAGRFYAAEDAAREAEVDALVAGFSEVESCQPFAAMVPHAGLRFSGRVAADVWRRVKPPERILIIGPKHTADGMDWAVAPHDRWQMTASSFIEGDVATARELAERIPGLELDAAAHAREHGIEIQLPLMHRYCPRAKLVAIAMSGGTLEQLQVAAKALAEWIREQPVAPLLVISSDMNHYAEDSENRRRDRLALDALATGDGSTLLRICSEENISMCGQVPAAWAMMTMRELGIEAPADELAYATSADAGGRSRTCGWIRGRALE